MISGECDVQQMSIVVEELRRRIEAFSAKVDFFSFFSNIPRNVLFLEIYTHDIIN